MKLEIYRNKELVCLRADRSFDDQSDYLQLIQCMVNTILGAVASLLVFDPAEKEASRKGNSGAK